MNRTFPPKSRRCTFSRTFQLVKNWISFLWFHRCCCCACCCPLGHGVDSEPHHGAAALRRCRVQELQRAHPQHDGIVNLNCRLQRTLNSFLLNASFEIVLSAHESIKFGRVTWTFSLDFLLFYRWNGLWSTCWSVLQLALKKWYGLLRTHSPRTHATHMHTELLAKLPWDYFSFPSPSPHPFSLRLPLQ